MRMRSIETLKDKEERKGESEVSLNLKPLYAS